MRSGECKGAYIEALWDFNANMPQLLKLVKHGQRTSYYLFERSSLVSLSIGSPQAGHANTPFPPLHDFVIY